MGLSAWDKYLREILGEFKSESETQPWEEFAQDLDPAQDPLNITDPLREENLRDTLSNFKPDTQIEGWDRIQASLDATDKEFDEKVRKKIHHYEPHFDPLSWPVFLKKLADTRALRIKLIALKIGECAAFLLLLLTVVNVGRMGKLPFETPLFENTQPPTPDPNPPVDKAYVPSQHLSTDDLVTAEHSSDPNSRSSVRDANAVIESNTIASSALERQAPLQPNYNGQMDSNLSTDPSSTSSHITSLEKIPVTSKIEPVPIKTALQSDIPEMKAAVEAGWIESVTLESHQDAKELADHYVTNTLASIDPEMAYQQDKVPNPTFVLPVPRTFIEFGILSQVDYNMLRMPEDRLYSAGKQIVFPQQGIPSQGFGAGFTLAIGHPLWALETGIIYSSKEFKPGRELVVGGAFDNGSVEFDAMRLQLVSIPFQFRYRFEPKGRMKAYALAGLGVHVIAESNIDVLIDYHFPTLSFGENPINNPSMAETIRETYRIREHIRDGAPFSTKSFGSLHAGLGLEYTVAQQKVLFLQSVFQYQIPNLKFSNNNGKHIRSVSLQVGVRTPLGV